MKFDKENYRIILIENEDMDEAKKRVDDKVNLVSISGEDELQGQLGEMGTELLLKTIKNIHNTNCKKGVTEKLITLPNGGVVNGKVVPLYEGDIITPLHCPKVENKDNSKEQSKMIFEKRADNDLINIELGDVAKLSLETKTKKCKNQYWFDMFIREPDMLFSLFKDKAGNKFNQLIDEREDGFTIIWGILYEPDIPTKMYCYFFSNYEIRYMLKPKTFFEPIRTFEDVYDESLYKISLCMGGQDYHYPSNKYIIESAKEKLDKTKLLIPEKGNLVNGKPFNKYQTEDLWNKSSINLILDKLRSYIYCSQIICLEEPFYRISIEWEKTEYASRVKLMFEIESKKDEADKPCIEIKKSDNKKENRERLISDARLVFELQGVFPLSKLNELFQNI